MCLSGGWITNFSRLSIILNQSLDSSTENKSTPIKWSSYLVFCHDEPFIYLCHVWGEYRGCLSPFSSSPFSPFSLPIFFLLPPLSTSPFSSFSFSPFSIPFLPSHCSLSFSPLSLHLFLSLPPPASTLCLLLFVMNLCIFSDDKWKDRPRTGQLAFMWYV